MDALTARTGRYMAIRGNPLRLVNWNMNHRTSAKRIPPGLVDAVWSLGPDVAVLTEYVPGPSHPGLVSALEAYGLTCRLSGPNPGHNHILIAARGGVAQGHLRGPDRFPAFPSNVLHVELADPKFDVLGLRIPVGKKTDTKPICWDWIIGAAEQLRNRPSVLVGDFNTDPGNPRARCRDRIAKLTEQGWQLVIPSAGASYWGPKGREARIDYAFASRSVRAHVSDYVTSSGSFVFAGPGPRGASDHAVFVMDFDV